MSTDQRGYFDAMYGANDDPYALRTRWYEARKRSVLLAALPRPFYERAYEPGCGVGELTVALAERCKVLLASDRSERAVAIARQRTQSLPNVRIEQHALPSQWPRDEVRFDLIVLSELCYFVDADALRELATCCENSLNTGGSLVACDWRPDFRERVLATDEVHATLGALGLSRLVRHEEDDFLLHVWSRDGRSVATREGIR